MMKQNLATKLILAFTLIAVTTAALVGMVIWLTSPARLGNLVTRQQLAVYKRYITNYYKENGTLDNIGRTFPQVDQPFNFFGNNQSDQGFAMDRRVPFVLVNENRRVVLAYRPEYVLGMLVTDETLVKADPIEVDGKVIGYILAAPERPGFTTEELTYLRQTYRAMALAAVAAIAIALVVGTLLARSLTRPLRDLKQAAQKMTSGDLQQQVAVHSRDEIGELGQAFNQMSSQLAHSNEMRRQMTADIAHDLRTPLTVIAGYVESMRDGVLAPTPQRLETIYAEIERLQRMVEDLRTLTRAEAGEQAAAAFQHQAEQHGVQLRAQSANNLPALWADETRIMQVLGNLITNALRYTPEGGQVTLSAARDGNWMALQVSDTGSGIAAEDLPKVFDRFYRGDSARSEQGGESGLGLAIARAYVQAHGGEINAVSLPGQGSTFTIRLPLKPPTAN